MTRSKPMNVQDGGILNLSISELKLSKDKLLELYEKMLTIRYFEQEVSVRFAQGEIPGFVHLSLGQEAVAAGICANLRKDDYITTTHRGHGHCIAKGANVKMMMAELYGRLTGYCKGKGGSLHVADFTIGVLGANGIVGGNIPIAVGAGLSIKIRGTDQVAVAFFGDGAANQGTFHEGINLAAIWELPVIFVCENNLYASNTPQWKTMLSKNIADRAAAYGISGVTVDGNDVLAVYNAAYEAVQRARNGKGPTLLECKTYRWRGHFEGDPALYRPKEEFQKWMERDPVKLFKAKLIENSIMSEEEAQKIEQKVLLQIQEAVKFARESPFPPVEESTKDVFSEENIEIQEAEIKIEELGSKREITYVEATLEAIKEEMRRNPNIFLMGEDITGGGWFGQFKGLVNEFGEKRVRDTPISEAGFVGAALGAALTGMRPMVVVYYPDFLTVCMDQIVNQIAKVRYMFGGQAKAPVVLRVANGTGRSAGAHHSQSFLAWFMHIPGLKIAAPSTPFDAKGLLKTALNGDDPVMFFEHCLLYYKKGFVPENEYRIPLGKADIKRKGKDVTVVGALMGVQKALAAAEILAKEGIDVEVVDPRTLVPLDKQTIINSVKKTGKLVIVEEDVRTCGVGAEIASLVFEEAFGYLDAPVKRVATLDVPIPFSPPLEKHVLPNEQKIVNAVKEIMKY